MSEFYLPFHYATGAVSTADTERDHNKGFSVRRKLQVEAEKHTFLNFNLIKNILNFATGQEESEMAIVI